jgi:hypothetical protein
MPQWLLAGWGDEMAVIQSFPSAMLAHIHQKAADFPCYITDCTCNRFLFFRSNAYMTNAFILSIAFSIVMTFRPCQDWHENMKLYCHLCLGCMPEFCR